MPSELNLFSALTVNDWLIIAGVAIFLGIAKAGLAGMGILVIPIFAQVFPAKQSVGILLPLLIVGDILAVIWYRHNIVWRELTRTLPLAALGIIGGYGIMKTQNVDDRELRWLIGITVLLMLAVATWNKWRARNRPPLAPTGKSALLLAIIFGLIGGMATMMANAAGPIFVLYLLYLGLSKPNFVGTNAMLLLILNCFKVPFQWSLSALSYDTLQFNFKAAPFIVIGFAVGVVIVNRLSWEKFDGLMRFLTAVAAIKLLV